MEKLIYSIAVLATIMLSGACQKEVDFLAGDTNVTFTVSTGEIATKAEIADGKNIDILYWELYGADPANEDGPLGEGKVEDDDYDKEFTLNLKLVADQDYNIIFWAQVDGKNYYIVDDLRSIKINKETKISANDESRAAFFADFDFQKIADYYAHADKKTQEVMKRLGLVSVIPKEAYDMGMCDFRESFDGE